jgi:hypothetical protein
MQIFIAGGSGYIGSCLSEYFLAHGHEVIATGGRKHHPLESRKHFSYICSDTSQDGAWQESLQTCQVVINLAGKTIFRHWTDQYKKKIYQSRIATTEKIAAALPKNKSILFCSASAVGYYGNGEDNVLTESAPSGNDFLSKVARDWEHAAMSAENEYIRVVTSRFGIVLSRDDGAIAKMLPVFRFFLGGPLGDGNQWFSWLHIEDLIAAMAFILENPEIRGPVNFCSPYPVRNREFTRMLARALSRPALMKVPSFALRFFLGEFGETLLVSQHAIPEKLVQNGFKFKFDRIENAIADILNK